MHNMNSKESSEMINSTIAHDNEMFQGAIYYDRCISNRSNRDIFTGIETFEFMKIVHHNKIKHKNDEF